MIKGAKPTTLDHRDYDFHKTHHPGLAEVPDFPPEYRTDRGLWVPDQVIGDPKRNFRPLPAGCTEYATSGLVADLDGVLRDPNVLENIVHANANGGAEERDVLLAARDLGWLGWFFSVNAYGPLDWFDAFRLAQVSGGQESRSIAWTTPWFPSWEAAASGTTATKLPDGSVETTATSGGAKFVMPMPTDEEFRMVADGDQHIGWHETIIGGWATENGELVLTDLSLQGTRVGRNGVIAFPRDVVNRVMQVPGTSGFTATLERPPVVARVNLGIIDWVKSHLNQLLGLRY